MKDAYWFPHDSNALSDPKIIQLMSESSFRGYGLFWACLEIMMNESSYQIDYSKINAFAYHLHLTEDELKSFLDFCIKIDLFKIKNNFVYSSSLLQRMAKKDKISAIRKDAANKKWHKNQLVNANALQTKCKSNANIIEYNIKEKNNTTSKEQVSAVASPLKRKAVVSYVDFIDAIKKNPAYSGVDVDNELHKMDAWFLTPKGRGRKKTEKFILNWLNRAERSLPPEETKNTVKRDMGDIMREAAIKDKIKREQEEREGFVGSLKIGVENVG